jgi:hypothetical protein
VFFHLTDYLTRRFTQELRTYWTTHPKFEDLPENIQGKYSFRERPQRGIVVKSTGGTHSPLSADNYKGIIYSHCHLAKANNKPGYSVEWVREDGRAIQANGGTFPSPPGVYYLDVREENNKNVFYVDPLLNAYQEQVMMTDATTGMLQTPPLSGSLRLYEMPARYKLVAGTNYTLETDPGSGAPTGVVNFNTPLSNGRWIQADYRYVAESSGPYPIRERHANNTAIPGVVLAFGRRVQDKDQLAVVVEATRMASAMEYGGRWEMAMEFEVFARDVYDQREIADNSVMYLFGSARGRLSSEGLEVMNISIGGESEEIYDETGNDYFFNSSFSLNVETEWAAFVPLNVSLRQATPLTQEQANYIASLSDDELDGHEGNIKAKVGLGLESVQDPFYQVGRGYPIIR